MHMKYNLLFLAMASASASVMAEELPVKNKDASANNDLKIEVIEVTARKNLESLQDVPDAVTAFNAAEIESAHIENVGDVANLTPNLVIRQGFRAGVSFITMRGISTPQQGLPPVTFVVDGVQAGSMDFINQDLNNIERIEVLRGPQGALYGAGAMAGAINIITKAPEKEWSGSAKLQVAEGNDKSANVNFSGGLSDEIFGMVAGNVRKSDGLVDSSTGEDLDFVDSKQFRTRWQYLGDQFTADLRLGYSDYEQGAVMSDVIRTADDITAAEISAIDIDDFSTIKPERSFIGKEQRTFHEAVLKLGYEFDNGMNLSWISSQQKVDQGLIADLDWSTAPIFLQDLTDNFEVNSHELKLSNSEDSYNWLIGAYYQEREATNDLTIRLEPEAGVAGPGIFSQTDVKHDEINAIFGQVSVDLTEQLELTLAARYDSVEYDTYRELGGYTDENGAPTNTLSNKDTSFQPKVSLSYDVNDDLMVYSTIAKGFRPGFYNSGNLAKAETTENYEVGFKSTLSEQRLQLNGALFYIDYSNQQFSTIISEAPFRTTSNIPETKIKGLELEAIYLISENLRFTLGYGYTDAVIQEYNVQSPSTPKNTLNLGFLHEVELDNDWRWENRLDYRFQDEIKHGTIDTPLYGNTKHYFNFNTSFSNDSWRITLFGENLTDEWTPTEVAYIPNLLGVPLGVVRSFTPGRKIGASVEYKF